MINTACSAMIAKAAITYQRYCSHNYGDRNRSKAPRRQAGFVDIPPAQLAPVDVGHR